MHYSQTCLGHRYMPADQHYSLRNETSESHVPIYSEILKNLFFPYRDYRRITSNQHYQNRDGPAWLRRLIFAREGSHVKTDVTSLAGTSTKFSAVFDNGELGVGTPSLGIRLEQLQHMSSRARYWNNGHRDVIAETTIPLYDIKSMTVRKVTEDDYGRLGDSGFLGQDPNQDDYMYEVTLQLSAFGSRRFTVSPYYRDHTYAHEVAKCLKDMHKNAESIRFHILGPREAWDKLKRLQEELGLRGDSSTKTIFVGPNHRSGRMGSRWGGGPLGGRDIWNRSPSFEDDDDLVRGDWVNVRMGGRYGYRDGYRDFDVDYVY
ncbi:hypothetical protein TWF481_005166 [Arthrobotrys musiformis]|uniref:Uncharacterized protein n=1 Tax=Arthrobotrys musiformis TaxID=47236 RepID=A0AAV9WEM8_9PEZI